MSIISDALKKAADKRRDIVRLPERKHDRRFRTGEKVLEKERVLDNDPGLERQIEKISSKKTGWNLLSSVGTLLIVGFAIVAFMFNKEFIPSFTFSSSPAPDNLLAAPKRVFIEDKYTEIADRVRKETVRPPVTKRVPHTFKLNGIIEGGGEPLAIIDDRIVRKGELIYGAEVVEIGSERVILLSDDKEVTLHLH